MGFKVGLDDAYSTTLVDVAKIGGLVLVAGSVGWYLGHKGVFGKFCGGMKVNLTKHKEQQKVVNSVDVEDLPEKGRAYCRCWRSNDFPYCDGAHNAHNLSTGDNVGPLLVKKGK